VQLAEGIDRYLRWREIERGATPRLIESYRRILAKLADRRPQTRLRELAGPDGTQVLRAFLEQWAHRSASTRCNVISVVHSFFAWAFSEELIESDPSARIRRPPKRKPQLTRPSQDQLAKVRAAATVHELPTILLLEGAGLRNSEVRAYRWERLNLERGRVHVLRKGQHWQTVPLAPDVVAALTQCKQKLAPEPDDHVFTVEVERWVSATQRVRERLDPKRPASSQALGRMVRRVFKRAGVPPLSPHALRHGFATHFLRQSGRDLVSLQALMGHARPDTRKAHTDELDLEELEAVLANALKARAKAAR